MFALRCTVRNCDSLLNRRDECLVCDAGHSFDRAKQGYWNLTQPQDRKSTNPGDTEEAVMARHRWLQRGFMDGLVDTLKEWLAKCEVTNGAVPRTMDLGCGEGTLAPKLFAGEETGYCGIDLSKRAMRIAARNWPGATWVLANADRTLPAADHSVDRVVSLFGRRPATEIARVLTTTGVCIIAVPGEADLIELRELAQRKGYRRSRWESIVEELDEVGLRLIEHKQWQDQVQLDAEAIADAMAMTYRAVRFSQQARLGRINEATVTLAADLLFLKPS